MKMHQFHPLANRSLAAPSSAPPQPDLRPEQISRRMSDAFHRIDLNSNGRIESSEFKVFQDFMELQAEVERIRDVPVVNPAPEDLSTAVLAEMLGAFRGLNPDGTKVLRMLLEHVFSGDKPMATVRAPKDAVLPFPCQKVVHAGGEQHALVDAPDVLDAVRGGRAQFRDGGNHPVGRLEDYLQQPLEFPHFEGPSLLYDNGSLVANPHAYGDFSPSKDTLEAVERDARRLLESENIHRDDALLEAIQNVNLLLRTILEHLSATPMTPTHLAAGPHPAAGIEGHQALQNPSAPGPQVRVPDSLVSGEADMPMALTPGAGLGPALQTDASVEAVLADIEGRFTPEQPMTGAQAFEVLRDAVGDTDGNEMGVEFALMAEWAFNHWSSLSPEAQEVFAVYEHYAVQAQARGERTLPLEVMEQWIREMAQAAGMTSSNQPVDGDANRPGVARPEELEA